MQHDHVLKKLNFDLLTPSRGSGGGGGGYAGKIFGTVLLQSLFLNGVRALRGYFGPL